MNENVPLTSVAHFILFPDGEDNRMFAIQELTSKPRFAKFKGNYSVPWETQEEKESDEATLARLNQEEVDATGILKFSEPVLLQRQIPVLGGRATASVYLSWYVSGPVSLARGKYADKEIRPLGFQKRELILSNCRGGIPELFEVLEAHEAFAAVAAE